MTMGVDKIMLLRIIDKLNVKFSEV